MNELDPDQYSLALSLETLSEISFPLIRAVLERSQPGRVFTDNNSNPSSALVLNRFGFMQLIGDTENRSFNDTLEKLLFHPSSIEQKHLLWYDPSEAWADRLNTRSTEASPVRHRRRARQAFDPSRFSEAENSDHLNTSGATLKQLDADTLEKAAVLNLDIPSRFWPSAASFLERRLGIVATIQGQVVSVCYAACVADGKAEIDIATSPSLRGQGLASAVAAEFIRLCLTCGVEPAWDCFENNAASVRLAQKLGFIEQRDYSFFSFNRPSPAI